jgi:hypothetical protein
MARSRFLLPVLACLALGAAATPASAAPTKFRPRIGAALGLMPPVTDWGRSDIASGALTPVTYHGGSVMAGGVTIHTIFWDGGGNGNGGRDFQGQPTGAPADYIGMIERFFGDVAADSGTNSNVYSVLPQFAEGTSTVTPGSYNISYDSTAGSTTGNLVVNHDAIIDHNPYPAKSDQCSSPQETAICITDQQVRTEVDHVINATSGTRGLHDIWFVFTPPDVDECILPGECETNAYGGYHSVSDEGDGQTIYGFIGDPIVESRNVAHTGTDPEGYPDAEIVADIAAHESVEAITDPQGVGYMDPNGFEVADKCEFGPQDGDPLGFAPNGSPYNQLINGHKWDLQEMWANHDNQGNPDCVQRTTTTTNDLPLPQVSLTQFSGTVTGDIEHNTSGVHVTVTLLRANPDGSPETVATGTGTTGSNGTWSATLSGGHVVGDDRDEIDVDYSGSGAPTPSHQVILTGNGGNPFTESGWTGWTAMDNGTFLTTQSGGVMQIAPCFQTGVLAATVASHNVVPPPGDQVLNDTCSTQTDVATFPTGAITPTSTGTVSSLDNRAFQDPNLSPAPNTVGSLVNLKVPTGEPDSVSLFQTPLIFQPGGFPTCAADLEAKSVSCQGLVPGANYTVTDGSSHTSSAADDSGTVAVAVPVKGGDTVTLTRNGGSTLTTLHVANLRVAITGQQNVLSGGTCSPDQYYGAPLSSAPTSAAAGAPSAIVGGAALTGAICPNNGQAAGLPDSSIIQTDEHSQGSTQTEVPDLEDTSPMEGETVYGRFTALAETGFAAPDNSVTPDNSAVALSIKKSSGGSAVFTASNVNTTGGVTVKGLKPGTYIATWTVKDANGDTRTVTTRFVEQSALVGPRGPRGPRGPKPKVSCHLVKHHKIKCTVRFPKSKKGKLQVRLSRGSRVAALGHARVNGRTASVTLNEVRHVTRGAWSATLVLSASHQRTITTKLARVRVA